MKGKKLLSIFVAGAMLLSTMGFPVFADGEATTEPNVSEDVTATDENGNVGNSYVAKIGDNNYTTLAEAVAAAKTGDTVELLANNTEEVAVDLTKGYTLDFNNFYATGATIITNSENYGVSANNEKLIAEMQKNLPDGYILKYNDSTWDGEYTVSTGNYAAETVFSNGTTVKFASLGVAAFFAAAHDGETSSVKMLSDWEVSTVDDVISIGNPYDNTPDTVPNVTIELNGYTISGTWGSYGSEPVQVFNGKLTIKDSSAAKSGKISSSSTYTGTMAVYGNSQVIIESGTIENTANGNAIFVATPANINSTSVGGDAEVSVTGGKIDGKLATISTVISGKTGTPTIAVSGGTFTKEIEAEYCAEGFIPTANEDGTYGVKVGAYVVELDGIKYEEFDEAYNLWKANGGTLKLLNDVDKLDVADCIHVGPDMQNAVLDLNGYSFKVRANGSCSANGTNATHFIRIYDGGTLTVTDSSAEKDGVFSYTYLANSNAFFVEVVNGTFNMDAGTITNETTLNYGGALVYVRKGAFNMTGGTLSAVKPTKSITVTPLWLAGSDATANITDALVLSTSRVAVNNGGTLTVSNSTVCGNPTSLKANCVDQVPVYDGVNTVYGTEIPETYTATLVRGDKTYYYTYSGAAKSLIDSASNGDYITVYEDAESTKKIGDNTAITIKCENGAVVTGISAYDYYELFVTNNEDGSVTYTADVTESSGLVKGETADGVVDYYVSISAAATAVKDGGKLTLLKDFVSTSAQTVLYNVTLDLNGKTIEINKSGSSYAALGVTSSSSNYAPIVLTVVDSVGGGKVINTATNGNALIVKGNADNKIIVKSGTFSGNIVETLGSIEIFGGTFTNDVSAFLADGYKLTVNADGTYGVVLSEEEAEPEILKKSLYVTYSQLGKYDFGSGEVDSIKLSFFAGVDTLNYSEVGFDVTVNGVTQNFPITIVYDSVKTIINGEVTVVKASEFGEGVNHIFGYTINFPATAEFENASVTWVPYAIKDGVKITGNTFVLGDIFPGTLEVSE